nr:hypothetical protein [Tanacetum cinerariifolium]
SVVEVEEWGRRVRESDIGDQIDRETRNLFGFAEKSPPEKFSGGGRAVAGWSAGGWGREKRILKKKTKTMPKTTKPNIEWKRSEKTKSFEAESQKLKPEVNKVNPGKVKVNPGNNNNKDAQVDGKEHDDDIQKSVSPNIYSSSSGAQTRKQGDKTENKDKGKSHVVTITGFRDLNAEFKEYNNSSSNGVNAASSSVSTAGQNSINSTNEFSAAGPLNATMPNLEDLSHDADDVGAEADINNLESIILVSPIPTTRIYKDHPTSQIISDMSSTTQTRSMARTIRDQGGIS